MKPLYRNIFFLLGAVAVVIMLLTFDMDYKELWSHIRRAGWWFGAVVGVWVVIYFFNAVSWYFIIRNGESPSPVSLGKVYKLTISGFALNYATPCGLMGGEPYRIMELTPIIGSSRATSSVILYVMMHIFSHICFWLASVVLYIIMYTRIESISNYLYDGFSTLYCKVTGPKTSFSVRKKSAPHFSICSHTNLVGATIVKCLSVTLSTLQKTKY